MKNKIVFITLINLRENNIEVQIPHLEQLISEEFKAAHIHATQIKEKSENQADGSRTELLQETLQTNH